MKIIHYCILLVIILSWSCCKKDNSPSPFTETSYPLTVGNWWEYQVNQTAMGGGYDTVILIVISMSKINSYVDYLCTVTLNGTIIDSGNFFQSDTSLSFINSLPTSYYSLFPNFYLKFHVATGQYWQGSFAGDSILVTSVVNSYSAYGHTYGPCYYTKEAYDLPHNFKVSSMIYTPKVGLIEGAINFISDTADKSPSYSGGVQIQQSILLLDYYVQ
jgi:hypothetical protein